MSDKVACPDCGTMNAPDRSHCRECDTIINKKLAKAEAKANKPKRSFGKILLGFIGIMFLCGIIAVAMGGGDGSPSTNTGNASNGGANDEDTEAAVEPSYGIGDEVRLDDLMWIVQSASDEGDTLTSSNAFVDDLTGSRFIRIEYQITNMGNDATSHSAADLIDSQGREFNNSTDAISFIDSDDYCILSNLNPEVPRTCVAIYEVPTSAQGLSLKATNGALFGEESALIDLGIR